MDVSVSAVRVYGSQDQYGEQPRTGIPDEPLVLADFPVPGHVTAVYLGEIPQWLVEAYRVRKAGGILTLLKAFGGEHRDEETDEVLQRLVASEETRLHCEDWNWYVTLELKKKTCVEDCALAGSKYFWMHPRESLELQEESERSARVHFNRVARSLSFVIGPAFFANVVVEGAFFSAPGRRAFAWPHFRAAGTAQITRPAGALDVERIGLALRDLRELSAEAASCPDTATRWYLAALQETDAWKQFVWCFLALEVLTNKLSARFRTAILGRLDLRSAQGDEPMGLGAEVSTLVPHAERLTLTERFTIMALSLSPDSAGEDLATFKKAKRARDELLHGGWPDPVALPLPAVQQLLAKYLRAASQGRH